MRAYLQSSKTLHTLHKCDNEHFPQDSPHKVQIKVISGQYMRTAARCQHRDSYPIHFAIEASSTYQSPHMGRWVPVTAGLDPLCWLPSLPDSRVPPGCHWQHKTCDWGQPHNGAHLMPPQCRAPTGQTEHMCSTHLSSIIDIPLRNVTFNALQSRGSCDRRVPGMV